MSSGVCPVVRRVSSWMQPFVQNHSAVILDGGMGTTLAEQGANVAASVASAFWSSEMFFDPESPVSPDLVYKIHYDFLKAGADVIIANTYQVSQELSQRVPTKGHIRRSAHDVIQRTVSLAIKARDDFHKKNPHISPKLICAAFGPYGASIPFSGAEYVGNYPCSYDDLVQHWKRKITSALTTQCDLLGAETIPDLRETKAIVQALNELEPDRPVWICWTCKDEKHIHGGPLLLDCVNIVENCQFVDTIGVNCTAPDLILPILEDLHLHSSKSLLVYPNSGRVWDAREEVRQWTGKKQAFDHLTTSWINAGAAAIGGCCDCNDVHIRSLAKVLQRKSKL